MIGLIPLKAYLQMLGLLLQVLEYLGVIGLIRTKALLADARAPLTSPGVLGGDRAYSTSEVPADARCFSYKSWSTWG